MNDSQEELLADLFGDAGRPDARARQREALLGAVRRRNRMRRWRSRTAAAGVALAVVGLWWGWSSGWGGAGARLAGAPGPMIARPEADAIAPTELPRLELVATDPRAVEVVHSQPAARIYREIDETELLSLAGGEPVALIPQGPGRAELVFLASEN